MTDSQVAELLKPRKRTGLRSHRLYFVFAGIRARCNYKSVKNYHLYGGRGIKIAPEISTPWAFIDYVSSLPNYPENGGREITLDRIDNDKDYEPGNLRWATMSVQIVNRGRSKVNTTGYTGVTLNKKTKGWFADLKYQGKTHHIGTYKTPKEAAIARNEYIIKNNLPHQIQKV